MRQADWSSKNVPRETLRRLKVFVDLLCRWNSKINLISHSTTDDIWRRHVDDSLQLFDFLPPNAAHWADLGSGGGFPGMVIALAAADLKPELSVTLVETDQRKAAFLAAVARSCGVSPKLIVKRAETIEPLNADVLSARALAPLSRLLPLADRHLAKSGLALFPKGVQYEGEIAMALEQWRFRVHKHQSAASAEGVILAVEEISRV